METATRDSVRAIAGQLAVITGTVHLGFAAFHVVAGQRTGPGDPRILVWTVAGVVLFVGVLAARKARYRRRVHALGATVVGLLVAGHLLWPAVAGEALYLGATPRASLAAPLAYVAEGLLDASLLGGVLLGVEVALLGLLAVLFLDRAPR